MARVTKFEFYPTFDDDIRNASNKTRSSLRPLFDKVRSVTDEIYFNARDLLAGEAAQAEAAVDAVSPIKYTNAGKMAFREAKARAFALKSAANSVKPTMDSDGEIFGRVAIFRKNSYAVEFGGVDSVAEIGKGTGRYVEHPPYAPLRRAMDRAGG
jgi:hypothetical protein